MDKTNNSALSAFLFGLICIVLAILMFFGSNLGQTFGGLMCTVVFGVVGGLFAFYGYELSRKN